MKFKKKFLLLPIALMSLSSCSLLQGFEDEVNVVFEYNNEIIYSDYTTQFRNVLMPTLSEKQIPVDHEFFGWTWKDPDTLSIKDDEEGFYASFFEKEGVIHYADVADKAFNSTVTLYPVFALEADIPVEYHYLAVGWYQKTGTSGLNQERVDAWTNDLMAFLKTQGATDEDLSTVLVKGYDGNVATAGSLITKDKYVDVLIGFGKNMTDKDGGGLTYALDAKGDIPMGGKSRYVHLLSDKPIARAVFDWVANDPAGSASLA